MKEKPIGEVTHFFGKINVAVIKAKGKIATGDQIKIARKNGEEFTQTVESMQVEHEEVKAVKKGEEAGMKVDKPVKEGDLVYKTE